MDRSVHQLCWLRLWVGGGFVERGPNQSWGGAMGGQGVGCSPLTNGLNCSCPPGKNPRRIRQMDWRQEAAETRSVKRYELRRESFRACNRSRQRWMDRNNGTHSEPDPVEILVNLRHQIIVCIVAVLVDHQTRASNRNTIRGISTWIA